MLKVKRILVSVLMFSVLVVVCGCNPPKAAIQKFNEYYTTGQYDLALEYSESKISKKKSGKGEDVLWCLNAGTITRMQNDLEKSNSYFDTAEEMMNKHAADRNKAGETVGSTLINDNVVAYLGKTYDGIMANVYKGLNFMELGNNELARVEFNRALDRQRRALEYYNKEVDKLQKDVDKKNKENKNAQPVDNSKFDELISRNYPDLEKYEVFSDFVNPFANYMAGLFFYLDGDYSKSLDLLKESAGMNSDNEYIVADFKMVEGIALENKAPGSNVWVIYENGLCPVREEMRFGLPIPVSGEFIYITIALPKLESRGAATANLTVSLNEDILKSEKITSMDKVIQTEFKKEFGMTLTRAIMSATAKAVLQYSLRDQSPMVRLAALATVVISTTADVRMWTSLPKDFQVIRMDMPEDKKVNITIPGNEEKVIELPDCKNAIIYVKLPVLTSVPVYDIISFE